MAELNCWPIPLLLVVGLASGCALSPHQRDATARFALASQDIGDFAAREFTHLRAATIDMNVTNVAIGGTADKSNLDEALDVDRVVARVKAARALTSYGTLLWALVSETQEEELKKASDDFVNSVRSVSGHRIGDSQLQALGQLVQQIGALWVEARKADAVKRIVPAVAPDVDALCDLLIADFSETSLHVGQGFDATITRLRVDADIALADPSTRYADRLVAMRGQKQAEEAGAHLHVISRPAVTTLQSLKLANAELDKAIRDDSLSVAEIQAVGMQIKSLKTALEVVTGKP
ncbi:hypothetical protein ACW73L_03620 [Methylolobus aquaticus]